jgi:hypothetical protein
LTHVSVPRLVYGQISHCIIQELASCFSVTPDVIYRFFNEFIAAHANN